MAVTISWTNWKTLRDEYCGAAISSSSSSSGVSSASSASSSSPSSGDFFGVSSALAAFLACCAATALSTARILRARSRARKTKGTSVYRTRPRPPWPRWRRAAPRILNWTSTSAFLKRCVSLATRSCSDSSSLAAPSSFLTLSSRTDFSSWSFTSGEIIENSFSTLSTESRLSPAPRTARTTHSDTNLRRRHGRYSTRSANRESSRTPRKPTVGAFAGASGRARTRSSCSASSSSRAALPWSSSDFFWSLARSTAAQVARQWFT
mmetsp:Transcript_268/g.807  ORF Transcript_268/g.807 Transcript_268/m.807 type:complete len:264 (-) Transcript_268:1194-1985(-)